MADEIALLHGTVAARTPPSLAIVAVRTLGNTNTSTMNIPLGGNVSFMVSTPIPVRVGQPSTELAAVHLLHAVCCRLGRT